MNDHSHVDVSSRSGRKEHTTPDFIPGLVCWWDFEEEPGQPRRSRGPCEIELLEGAGPVERGESGLAGSHCAILKHGQFFYTPNRECGPLMLDRFSLVAWVWRQRKPEVQCEAVAGIWNETLAQRQYALFLDLRIHGAADNVGAHVSATGGPTPGHRWCMEAAIGAQTVPYDQWHCIALTFGNHEAAAYLDGELDSRPGLNPMRTPYSRLHRGSADFTVGAVHRLGEMGNWFVGRIGGLAIFDRVLSMAEMKSLAPTTGTSF